MPDVKSAFAALRYLPCRTEGGEWLVVDQKRGDRAVLSCPDAGGAAVIAALMNGDLATLAGMAPEALASGRATLSDALLHPCGRPPICDATFPRL
ncbi:hypothetical protein DFR50_11484 [Roseiarcus fermentans]|uniref:Uncharacterized protein n=1 Tax=Roseiarcus fermentans TaxID=1473586 RepID=A0A366FEV0_9HYPH|nr:hypothetical protein [Roseiarcus fermentans]RBP12255.1 hypothetical protein DFR50_11484 [Roseiarcus fermentans]